MKFEIRKKRILVASEKWIKEAVIDLNLCPFAQKPWAEGRVRLSVCDDFRLDKRARFFLDELLLLQNSNKNKISTSLIIFSKSTKDFKKFLDFAASMESILKRAKAHHYFTLVFFHPNFILKGESKESKANGVGRSPYPMVHILRREDIDMALGDSSLAKAKEISLANKKKLMELNNVIYRKIFKK